MKCLSLLLAAGSWTLILKSNVVSATNKCYDDAHYRYFGDYWKDCKWIYDNGRCENHDQKSGYHVGKHYCPASCHHCDDNYDNQYDYYPDDHYDDHNDDHNDDHSDDHSDDHNDDHNDDCYDDSQFRFGGAYLRDCKWVGDEHKCDWSQNNKHIGEYHCPYSCGYCNDGGSDDERYYHCYDSSHYRYEGDSWKDCEWVAREHRCDKEHDGKHIGKDYCKKSCNYCIDYDIPTKKPTSNHDSCSDDLYYRYYGDSWKDCHWISENDRCNSFVGGDHVGMKYCQSSCGYCDNWHTPMPTKKPTKRPTRKPTTKPTAKLTAKPTVKPTAKPTSKTTTKPTTKEPTASCHSSMEVDSDCYEYHDPEKLTVSFANCHPEPKDWIGIYEAHDGHVENTLSWWGSSYMWNFACGSKNCHFAEEHGTIQFSNGGRDLKDGEYKAYLFDNNGYDVKASSDVFQVGNCNYQPSPTMKPISYCHNSVEVDSNCYKDHHPTELKLFFKNCQPQPKDWIGIYKVPYGYSGNSLEFLGNSFMWKFTCGSKTCYDPKMEGIILFQDWWSSLTDGQYRAYLFDNDGYHVKASSDIFQVGNCY